jgi:hypothetical protein
MIPRKVRSGKALGIKPELRNGYQSNVLVIQSHSLSKIRRGSGVQANEMEDIEMKPGEDHMAMHARCTEIERSDNPSVGDDTLRY